MSDKADTKNRPRQNRASSSMAESLSQGANEVKNKAEESRRQAQAQARARREQETQETQSTSAEQSPKVGKDSSGRKDAKSQLRKILQNLPAGPIYGRRPDPGGKRSGVQFQTAVSKTDEAEDRADRRGILEIALRHLSDMEKERVRSERDTAIEYDRMASAERIAAMRQGPRVYKFTANMNGSGGVNYRVKYKDIGDRYGYGYGNGDPGGRGSARYSSGGGGGRSPSEFMDFIERLLTRAPGGNGGRGVTATTTVKRTPKGPDRFDFSGWMPEDTQKESGKAFVQEDFFGAMDPKRSMRFGKGYLAPEYRDRYIEWAMRGMQPGDAGYQDRYKQANAMWNRVRADLDTRFRDYGATVMRDQQGASALKTSQSALKSTDGTATGAAVKAVADQGKKDNAAAAASTVKPVATYDYAAAARSNPNWSTGDDPAMAAAVDMAAAREAVARSDDKTAAKEKKNERQQAARGGRTYVF